MIYEHYCQACDSITEDICKVDDRKQFIACKKCGGSAERIISRRGGIQRDEPTWLASATENLCPDGAHRPESRTEFNRYLKDKGITQAG